MISRWWGNLAESCDVRLLIGSGACICWLLLLAVSPVFSNASTLIVQGLSWRILSLIVSGILFATGLAISACHVEFSRRCEAALAGGAGVAVFLSTLVYYHEGGVGAEVLFATCAGFAITVLCLLWARFFISVKLRKRVVGTVAGCMLGSVLYLVVVLLPPLAALIVGAAMPTVSAMCWTALSSASLRERDGSMNSRFVHTVAEQPLGSSRTSDRPFGYQLSLAIGLYGALFVLAGHVLPELEPFWMSSVVPGMVNVAAFLLVEVLLSVYMVKRVRRENPVVAYRPAAILVALAFLMLPFSTDDLAIACMAIAFSGFGSFMVFFWIVMGNICQKYGSAPLRVFSQGFLMLLAGILLGELMVAALIVRWQGGFEYTAILCVVALFLLVLMSWQMSDGSLMASETKEMGGVFFDQPSSNESEGCDFDAVVQRYRLSPREAQVLALLMKGRSIPYICDELFVAKSTVQTHVRHIYAKMEITEGRQELIDRVEGCCSAHR